MEVKMGGKPEQGACTDAADLPQIATVVRHMQKMTWHAQGAARDVENASDLAGTGTPPRGADLSQRAAPCSRSNNVSMAAASTPRSRSNNATMVAAGTPRSRSKDATMVAAGTAGRGPPMRPMSFSEAVGHAG